MEIRTRMKVTVMAMMTITAWQFLTQKTICSTVRQCHCKIYHQCGGMTSTIAHHHYGSSSNQLI
eukprot:8498976-Prorocentrum_lima.AAC.1